MSALGETVQSGETGTVDKLQKMPDQMPDNPATIMATTSLETIEQVMYKNWIWRNQFTVDTTMLAGHVFGLIKIHPKDCHDYLTYISRMFLTWTGSMKIRSRFQATFQFGGSFRLGWLPPKFTRLQIQNMPIQTLTAYPNIDLDPKNTCWMEFQAAEERNILFHWMEELENDNPDAFGGWFVFYVAAPLVISGGAGSSVTMLVESAGSFNFAQLAPITAITPSLNGILDTDSLFSQTGCDDFARIDAVQIFSNTIKSAPLGWFAARASQDRNTRDITRVILSDPLKTWVTAVQFQPATSAVMKTIEPPSFLEANETFCLVPEVVNNQPPINSEWSAYNPTIYNGAGQQEYVGSSVGLEYKYVKGNNLHFVYRKFPAQNYQEHTGCAISTASNLDSPFNFTRAGIQVWLDGEEAPKYDDSTMPLALSENLVGFVSLRHRSFSIQTTQHGLALAKSKLDDTTSQLYQLFATDSPTPLLTVRLTPYGYFTCNGTNTDALLRGKDLYLRYLQDLPMSTPIPSTYNEMKFVKTAALCTKREYNDEQLDERLWSRF